jgi:hypothetical protein
MEDEKIKIGISKIQNIKMTEREKENILKNILNFSIQEKKQIKSPYSFLSTFQKNHFAFYSMATFLILVLSGGGVAMASQKSLPGDILYTIKVSVIEPINSSIKFSTEEKAKYESGLAKERIIEAETLAYKGKLDPIKEKQINDLLIAHTNEFDKAINLLNKENQKEKAYSIATNFQYEMDARAESLDVIVKKIDSKKEDNNNTQIAITARNNAEKINLSYKKEEVKEDKKEYAKKEQPLTSTSISSPTAAPTGFGDATLPPTNNKKEN